MKELYHDLLHTDDRAQPPAHGLLELLCLSSSDFIVRLPERHGLLRQILHVPYKHHIAAIFA